MTYTTIILLNMCDDYDDDDAWPACTIDVGGARCEGCVGYEGSAGHDGSDGCRGGRYTGRLYHVLHLYYVVG